MQFGWNSLDIKFNGQKFNALVFLTGGKKDIYKIARTLYVYSFVYVGFLQHGTCAAFTFTMRGAVDIVDCINASVPSFLLPPPRGIMLYTADQWCR